MSTIKPIVRWFWSLLRQRRSFGSGAKLVFDVRLETRLRFGLPHGSLQIPTNLVLFTTYQCMAAISRRSDEMAIDQDILTTIN